MKIEERDSIIQTHIQIRERIKKIQREFEECISMIDEYKVTLINVEIEKLEEKKNKHWWM